MIAPSAPRWRRVLATAIDLPLFVTTLFLLTLITGAYEQPQDYLGARPWITGVALVVGSYLLLQGWPLLARAQTLGQMLLRLQIVRHADGGRPRSWQTLLVLPSFFLLLLLLATVSPLALIPAIDVAAAVLPGGRCIHDFVAGTRVVSRPQ